MNLYFPSFWSNFIGNSFSWKVILEEARNDEASDENPLVVHYLYQNLEYMDKAWSDFPAINDSISAVKINRNTNCSLI